MLLNFHRSRPQSNKPVHIPGKPPIPARENENCLKFEFYKTGSAGDSSAQLPCIHTKLEEPNNFSGSTCFCLVVTVTLFVQRNQAILYCGWKDIQCGFDSFDGP
jgi:hypothetical protein